LGLPCDEKAMIPQIFLFAAALLLCACPRSEPPVPAASPAAGTVESIITWEMRTFEQSDGDCTAPAGCAEVRVIYPEILTAPIAETREALNRFIRDAWLAPLFSGSEGSDLGALARGFFAWRRSVAPEAHVPHMSIHGAVDVLYQDPRAVSLRFGDTSYIGGEEEHDEVLLASFDPATGRRLALADLLAPGSEEALRTLAEARVRQIRGPAGTLPPSDNFAVVESGLILRYNPWSVGGAPEPVQIVLTRGELRGLARPDGPLGGAGLPRIAVPWPASGQEGDDSSPGGWESTDVPH
jgi:hypothetical protein